MRCKQVVVPYNQKSNLQLIGPVVLPLEHSKDLMDDLAWQIHEYLLSESTVFNGGHLVLIPITAIVKKFERNHRTIARRLTVLKNEGLLQPIIKKDTTTLYWIKEQEEES